MFESSHCSPYLQLSSMLLIKLTKDVKIKIEPMRKNQGRNWGGLFTLTKRKTKHPYVCVGLSFANCENLGSFCPKECFS